MRTELEKCEQINAEMYEALRVARIFVVCKIGHENNTYKKIDAAIAKAEGRNDH